MPGRANPDLLGGQDGNSHSRKRKRREYPNVREEELENSEEFLSLKGA